MMPSGEPEANGKADFKEECRLKYLEK